MWFNSPFRRASKLLKRTLTLAFLVCFASDVSATDFFLTIGGGYSREGNQASLEANVRFLQEVLIDEYVVPPMHSIYFADGDDEGDDLQVAEGKPRLTVMSLLSHLHSRARDPYRDAIRYRNHQVSGCAGASSPNEIRAGLKDLAARLTSDDRLFVYVTAHGSRSKGSNPYNTTIDCWGRTSISVEQLSRWLDQVSPDVPVVMVMAQCFCGGFAHAIFDEADRDNGLAKHLRTGFFAQQHDLAAAGCRPDVGNDEEYSSYFWGALVGRTRNGRPIDTADLDQDGTVSLAEAHAYAVLAGETIDIPLRASEALLRHYSRLSADDDGTGDRIEFLGGVSRTLDQTASESRPDVEQLIRKLCQLLDVELETPVNQLVDTWNDRRQGFRDARRELYRGRRRGTPLRERLREEVFFFWPELEDSKTWQKSELVESKNRAGLMADIRTLPSFPEFESYLDERRREADEVTGEELRQVKFRRLLETVISAELARNLDAIASDRVVRRYQAMLEVEESPLAP